MTLSSWKSIVALAARIPSSKSPNVIELAAMIRATCGLVLLNSRDSRMASTFLKPASTFLCLYSIRLTSFSSITCSFTTSTRETLSSSLISLFEVILRPNVPRISTRFPAVALRFSVPSPRQPSFSRTGSCGLPWDSRTRIRTNRIR